MRARERERKKKEGGIETEIHARAENEGLLGFSRLKRSQNSRVGDQDIW